MTRPAGRELYHRHERCQPLGVAVGGDITDEHSHPPPSTNGIAVAANRLVLPAPGEESMLTTSVPRRVIARRNSSAFICEPARKRRAGP